MILRVSALVESGMSGIHKTNYIILFFCVSGLIALFYILFFKPEKPVEHNQIVLTIKPFTQREEQDMLKAQAQEERVLITGPLITLMGPTEAEKKVLNLHEPNIQPIALQTLQGQTQTWYDTPLAAETQPQATPSTKSDAKSDSTKPQEKNTTQPISTQLATESTTPPTTPPSETSIQDTTSSAATPNPTAIPETPTESPNPLFSTPSTPTANAQSDLLLDKPADTIKKPKIKRHRARKQTQDTMILPAPGQTH